MATMYLAKDNMMPRSHIHGSPRRFYYGLNLTDDPGNANFHSPIRMHYKQMIKWVTTLSSVQNRVLMQAGG